MGNLFTSSNLKTGEFMSPYAGVIGADTFIKKLGGGRRARPWAELWPGVRYVTLCGGGRIKAKVQARVVVKRS